MEQGKKQFEIRELREFARSGWIVREARCRRARSARPTRLGSGLWTTCH